jgi:hypothetical protein
MLEAGAAARADVIDTRNHDFFGPALDFKIRGEDWGFRLQDLVPRVVAEHSRDDDQVPYAAAVRTLALVPRAELRSRNGEHFSGVTFERFLSRVVGPGMIETQGESRE